MKLEEMKVQGERVRTVSEFQVAASADEKERHRMIGTAVKVGVCAMALVGAIALRATGQAQEALVAASTSADQSIHTTDAPGSLRFVENDEKWAAPVVTNDVELLMDRKLVRFTAAEETVRAGMNGIVLDVDTDAQFGRFVRLQASEGAVLMLYGFETVAVRVGEAVTENGALGTVPIGRSVYLAVERDGARLNPSEYVDLTIHGRAATA